jgi:hypothetical protein
MSIDLPQPPYLDRTTDPVLFCFFFQLNDEHSAE